MKSLICNFTLWSIFFLVLATILLNFISPKLLLCLFIPLVSIVLIINKKLFSTLKTSIGINNQLKIKNKNLENEISHLKKIVFIDELTGLFNRRGFMVFTNQQLRLMSRGRKKMCLFYFDMDNLKSINDKFGHNEGDIAIKNLAVILTRTFRNSDIIARIGGDEFAVLAIDTEKDNVNRILQRLDMIINSYNKKISIYKMSVSSGVVECVGNETIDVLLSIADNNMYLQKIKKAKVV